jgi:hypothetical protein
VTDTVAAALIGVGGGAIVAVASVITQLFVTRKVIGAEREKIGLQLRGEEAARLREKRTDRIVDAVSELLKVSDPQIGPHVDYGRAVALTLRIQLLLDRHDQRHRPLVGALNNLALRLQEYVGVERLPIDDKSTETRLLLEAQGNVLERTRDALAVPPE